MFKGKRGVSVVVGYVLLIVIVISISIAVYAWMKVQLPKESEECPEGISLIIDSYSCQGKEINITFQNKGFFNVDGFIARIKNASDSRTYPLKNEDSDLSYFTDEYGANSPLKPNEKEKMVFSYEEYIGIAEIELEPFIYEDKVVLCDKAIISQIIRECSG